MSAEWIVIFIMLAFVIGMLLAICRKLNGLYTMIGRINQDYQTDRKRNESDVDNILDYLDDIKNEMPNRIILNGDTGKMYRK